MILWYHIYSGDLRGGNDPNSRNIRIFSYRFARMIDYLQFGNEVLGGSGHVYIQPNSLGGNSHGGLINDVKQRNSVDFLPSSEYEASIDFMLDWYADEMEAARIGSALAGRPMRVVGPALQAHRTAAAWNAAQGSQDYDTSTTDETTAKNNRARYLLEETARRDNDDRVIFDQHMYYLDPTTVPTIITELLNVDHTKNWPTPKARTIYEWGPQVDKGDDNRTTWWNKPDGGELNLPEYFRDDRTPPNQIWSDFVNDWLTEQIGDTAAGFSGALTAMDTNGFLHACYFPPVQEPQDQMDLTNPSIWWPPALDPFSVFRDAAEKYIKPPYWSPFKDDFELAASSHQVSPFFPHPFNTRPTCIDTCPGCANECSQ